MVTEPARTAVKTDWCWSLGFHRTRSKHWQGEGGRGKTMSTVNHQSLCPLAMLGWDHICFDRWNKTEALMAAVSASDMYLFHDINTCSAPPFVLLWPSEGSLQLVRLTTVEFNLFCVQKNNFLKGDSLCWPLWGETALSIFLLVQRCRTSARELSPSLAAHQSRQPRFLLNRLARPRAHVRLQHHQRRGHPDKYTTYCVLSLGGGVLFQLGWLK